MNAHFQRSKRFALVGLPLLVVFIVAVAINFGDGANPTGALVVILGGVFAFVAALMWIQRGDVARAAAADSGELPASALSVHDPTAVDADTLLVSLATGPIDRDAIAAGRRGALTMASESIGAGGRMIALIFVAVVPWILFGFIWSIVVVVPLIVGYAGYLSKRALGPGGQLDQGYEAGEAAVKPLGLRMTQRPEMKVRDRIGGPGAEADLEGALVYEGTRHGRRVEVHLEGLGSSVTIHGPVPQFELAAEGERLRATGAPATVESALSGLRASPYWRGLSAHAGPDGIVVERRRDGHEHWLRDLWLAEHLADAVS